MTPRGVARASDVGTSIGFPCKICGSVLKTRGNLRRHLRSLHMFYECPVCKKSVQTEKKFMFHMKLHASKRDYKCSLCSKTFSSIRSLSAHKGSHAKEATRQLPIQRSSKTVTLVPEPLKTKKAISSVKTKAFSRFKCTFCEKEYTSKGSLRRHLQSFHRKPVGKAKKVSTSLECHTNTSSTEENMIVSIPVQVSVSPRKQAVKKTAPHRETKRDLGTPTITTNNDCMQAQEHTTHIDNDKPFKCSFCDKAYSIKGSFNKHMRLKHGGLKEAPQVPSSLPSDSFKVEPHHNFRLNGEIAAFRCGSCDTLLDSLEVYKDHLLQHSSKSRFSCTVCGKPFPSASKLWVHQRRQHIQYRHRTLHPNQTTCLFPCSVCCQTFNTGDERAHHMRDSHGPCPVCDRVLSSKPCYKDHMNMHLGRRPYKCLRCPVKFYSRRSLDRHKCHQSGKRVKRKQVTSMAAAPILEGDSTPWSPDTTTLNAGQMSVQPVIVPYDNAQGRGFKCVLCGKVLSRRDAFRSHMNLHTGARPFACQYCDATFSRGPARWKHILDVHSDGKTRHTNRLQTAKKPRAPASLTPTGSKHANRKAKEDILTISTKTTSGQQESTPDIRQPPEEDHSALSSPSPSEVPGPTTPTSPTLGPSFSCGVCGATMQRYASYMAHMTQHTTGTPGQTTPKTTAVAIWNKKLRRSSRPRVKSPRSTDAKGSSRKVVGKRHTCKLCGGTYSNLKRHMYVAHPLPKSFRMQLRRSGEISTDKKESLELPQSVDGDNMMDMSPCEVQCSSESGKPLSVVDGGVSAHHVLPVCGEVNEEDQSCITDSHSDTVLVKYGSWNVFFFGNNDP